MEEEHYYCYRCEGKWYMTKHPHASLESAKTEIVNWQEIHKLENVK